MPAQATLSVLPGFSESAGILVYSTSVVSSIHRVVVVVATTLNAV
ncbi:hypothetical protein [Actinoplanes sp. NPDC023714]